MAQAEEARRQAERDLAETTRKLESALRSPPAKEKGEVPPTTEAGNVEPPAALSATCELHAMESYKYIYNETKLLAVVPVLKEAPTEPTDVPKFTFSVDHYDKLRGSDIYLVIDRDKSRPKEGKFFVVPVIDKRGLDGACLYFTNIEGRLVATVENKYNYKYIENAFGFYIYVLKPFTKIRFYVNGNLSWGKTAPSLILGENLRIEIHLDWRTPEQIGEQTWWTQIEGQYALVLGGRAQQEPPVPTAQAASGASTK